MNPQTTWCPWGANQEIDALVATLHETERRLEEMTAGEIDTVADRAGRIVLLRRAQEQLRVNDGVQQAVILNALPAQIALLDVQGGLVSTNDAWPPVAAADAVRDTETDIGQQCFGIADGIPGTALSDAQRIAVGIQSVLNGGAKKYSTEYSCQSPTERRWFLMMVSGLAADHPSGAVVMRIDVTERRRLETEVTLAASHEQQRFALDLHDVLGQDLVGLSLLAAAVARQSRAAAAVLPSDLEQIAAIAAKASRDARAMAHGLAPVGMACGNLEGALRQLAAAIGGLHEISISVITDGESLNGIETSKAEHIYRIAQEGLRNAAKHAQCRKTTIALNVRNAQVCLTIRDDGRGFTPGPGAAGIGLELMHYRANLIGGQLSIDSQRNGGTRVRCVCPAG